MQTFDADHLNQKIRENKQSVRAIACLCQCVSMPMRVCANACLCQCVSVPMRVCANACLCQCVSVPMRVLSRVRNDLNVNRIIRTR